MSAEQNFDRDLARLNQIRRAHGGARPTHENPAWMNCHGDCGFLLSFIDKLWKEYTRAISADELLGDVPTDGQLLDQLEDAFYKADSGHVEQDIELRKALATLLVRYNRERPALTRG
jgi:hypothetical protein